MIIDGRTRATPVSPTSLLGTDRAVRTTLLAFALAGALLMVPACEEKDQPVIDSRGTPPVLHEASVDPEAVDLRQIPPVDGRYAVRFTVRATASDADDSRPPSVVMELFRQDGTAPVLRTSLSYRGLNPSPPAGSRLYETEAELQITEAEAGKYRVRVSAGDAEGFSSSVSEIPFAIRRENSSPVLSQLSAPDTVTLPAADSLLIPLSVSASDADGQGDILEVYFRSLDSSRPGDKIFLFDDGGTASGDLAAGDGIYSRIIVLRPTATKRTYRFAFQAMDTFRDTSTTLLHFLTVQ